MEFTSAVIFTSFHIFFSVTIYCQHCTVVYEQSSCSVGAYFLLYLIRQTVVIFYYQYTYIIIIIYALAMLQRAWAACLWRFSSCSYSVHSEMLVLLSYPRFQSLPICCLSSVLGAFPFTLSRALCKAVLSSGICHH